MPANAPGALSVLVGSLVRTSHRVRDLEGTPIDVFVFEDMSVRERGRFTLEFRLDEACVRGAGGES